MDFASVAPEAEPSGLRQEARRRETQEDKSDKARLMSCAILFEKHIFLSSPRLSRLTDSAGEPLDDLKKLHCRALALKSLRDFIFSYLYIYIQPPPQMLFQVVRPL